MKITYSPQYDASGQHDKTYVMSAGGFGVIGKTVKFEDFNGQTIKFQFEPEPGSPLRLTACEARTMKQLKAMIQQQIP